ncbi:MFS transporter [Fusobacterium ulcerans]|uniref:MFS transporter n=1 Tax=Fusobacterium ulcerans TaxID=861 RepID=UPI001D09BCE9|nr:MFS transporter [Fusobacterium ulcerans]MCB8564215.1 MFS transporter [Fusobacterium ulcerans]MCB8648544.1 MFS transporter [Fusobacterium ulcerans]
MFLLEIKKQMTRFFILYFCVNLINNLIHPVTPAYVESLNMPDYVFGLLFATMSFSNFLFSPFWGELSDRKGRVTVIRICMVGYAVGQFGFAACSNLAFILFFRFFAGIFSGGFLVTALAYISDMTEGHERTKSLSFFAALVTMAVSVGFFIGGFIGKINIYYTFMLQIPLLLIESFLFKILLPESLNEEKRIKDKIDFKKIMKIIDIEKGKDILTFPIIVFFIGVILTEFSRVGFNNSFNFYIKSALKLPPSYNGGIMGMIGILGLFANLTINMWLANKFDLRKIFPIILFTNSVMGVFVLFFNSKIFLFFAFSVLFYIFNAIYVPIQQSLFTKGQSSNYGLLSGYFNSAKSFGMITGSLFTGFIYEINKLLPFVAVTIVLILSGASYTYNYFQYKKIGS